VALRGDVARTATAGPWRHRGTRPSAARRADQLRRHHEIRRLGRSRRPCADDFLRLYSVNTIGVFLMARACRAALVASGDGAIVNVSSLVSLTGGGSSLAYAARRARSTR